MTPQEKARIYAAFLNRLFIYRNITMDHNRIQQWLAKLDEWGHGCGEGWEGEEDFETMMAMLNSPETSQ